MTRIGNSWRTGIVQGMKNSEKSDLYELESDGTFAMKHRRFTNTALPVFSCAECWFQHFHIVKSNGWPEETAALQWFVHLKEEALNVALLLTREKRESWTGLVSGLSAYYQSPGGTGEAVRECVSPTGIGPSYVRNWVRNTCDPRVWGDERTGSGYDDKRQVHRRSETVRIVSAIGRFCTGHSYWGDRG